MMKMTVQGMHRNTTVVLQLITSHYLRLVHTAVVLDQTRAKENLDRHLYQRVW